MTLNTQLMTIVIMTLMGLEFAAAYDTYMRTFRVACSKKWIMRICDVHFMLGQAILMFFLLYKVNHGEIRIYIIIALICGYAIYQSVFRKPYMAVVERLIKIAVAIYKISRKVIIIFLVKPIKTFVKIIVSYVKFVIKLLNIFYKKMYYIAKRVVKVVILILYRIVSPIRIVIKIIPIKYRIKCKVNFEKIIQKINMNKKK